MVGDKANDLKLAVYSDAPFAGDTGDSKSTTGAYLCLAGTNTFVPATWLCKKQGAVSHTLTEPDMINLDAALTLEGLAALSFWALAFEVLSHQSSEGSK